MASNDTQQKLPINLIEPNPFQPRNKINEADETQKELVESVKIFGVLEPIVVAQTPAGYQIIAGERRWRAAKVAGLTEIPAVIKRTTPKGMLEMALVENVQRTNLSPLEKAQAFFLLKRNFGMTTNQVAERASKSAAYVSNTLALLSLPDAIKDGLAGGLITEGHARALNSIKDHLDMIQCYKIVLKENASVRRTEELARRYEAKVKNPYLIGKPVKIDDQVIFNWQNRFREIFHRPVQLKLVRSRRYTKVALTLKGNLEQTQADLGKILSLAGIKQEEVDSNLMMSPQPTENQS